MTLDGGFDFNSGWNFTFRNQMGHASMADETAEPPRDFKFFYKEDVGDMAKMEMWVKGHRYDKNFAFYITPDSMIGQCFQADEIMKDYKEQIGDITGYTSFMGQLSIFTGWYATATGINNQFGNYS